MARTIRRVSAAVILWFALAAEAAHAQVRMPDNFVRLRAVDPGIAQDIRYASSNNFVGRPLDGYEAPECVLRRDVAAALKRVQADLVKAGLSLKVYDCYRPERAVHAMVRWVRSSEPEGAGKRFHPRLAKRSLLSGYIAAKSRHSTGTAVDLTLIREGSGMQAAASPTGAPCTAPAAQRGDHESIDMGTGYDCLDPNAHTNAPAVDAEARSWRGVLAAAMRKHGFASYFREWWHFSYSSATPVAYYDFPIRSR